MRSCFLYESCMQNNFPKKQMDGWVDLTFLSDGSFDGWIVISLKKRNSLRKDRQSGNNLLIYIKHFFIKRKLNTWQPGSFYYYCIVYKVMMIQYYFFLNMMKFFCHGKSNSAVSRKIQQVFVAPCVLQRRADRDHVMMIQKERHGENF